jgi:FkbM family methyltransferase
MTTLAPTLSEARRTYAASLELVPSRDELPLLLDARGLFGCGVEIGVQRAFFSAQLLEWWHGAHLISIDPWLEDDTEQYVDIANVAQERQDDIYLQATKRLAPFGQRSTVWRLTSADASARIPRHTLDFAYIDARHDRESVLEDLDAWYDKIRPGGIIAGHDYLDGTTSAGVFGVKSAVDEFFGARGLAVHATTADGPWVSWMVAVPAPAAAAAVPSEATRTVKLAFETGGRSRELKLRLDPAHLSQRLMLEALTAEQAYEPETTGLLLSVLRDGDTFVDVGTHVGFFSTIAASLVGSAGRVVSFEPEEANFQRLTAHVSLNGFDNVETVNAAVGAEPATAELWLNRDNDGGHALWDVGRNGYNAQSRLAPERRAVRVTTLDHHFAPGGGAAIKLIKIDAEGSELRVLRGAEGLLRRHAIPYVVCEINRFALEQLGATEPALRAYMASLGYAAYLLHPATGEIVPLAPEHEVVTEGVFNLLFKHHEAPLVQPAA